MNQTIITFLAVCVFVSVTLAEGGKIERTKFYSQALEKNMLGDSPSRELLVYLPPSYDTKEAKRYPVIYLLHGNSPG
jgi:enterochelin esterase-like enzyme